MEQIIKIILNKETIQSWEKVVFACDDLTSLENVLLDDVP
jgi:hypothetical protein